MNKYKQAIKDIKYELARNYKLCKWVDDKQKLVLKERWQRNIDLLEELAEKAIPKKIIKKEKIKSCDLICPSCHKKLHSNCYYEYCKNETTLVYKNDLSYNYCPNCGQALDWSKIHDK